MKYKQEKAFAKYMAVTVWLSDLHCILDKPRLLVSAARIDGSHKSVEPEEFRRRILRPSYHLALAGHQGARRMYDSPRRNFHWHMIRNDDKMLVENCNECHKTGTRQKYRRILKLFTPAGPLELYAIDTLGLLPNIEHGNHFIAVIIDSYIELTGAWPCCKTSTMHMAKLISNH